MASKYQLYPPNQGISCHAWNADGSMLAVSPNNNEVHIYDTRSTPWTRLHVLNEHDMLVTSIDWSHQNNRIVTCAHDRNAFVWTYDAKMKEWKPALAVLRINRAALDASWSPDGKRFAVTSGDKCLAVCSYVAENDWWVSKIIKKKIKSTVLCCAFHPSNSQIIASGSADFRCRVFSTFNSDGVDASPISAPFASPLEFGELYSEITSKSWVNAVAWSPSGNKLAFACQDSTLTIATFTNGELNVAQILNLSFLPFMKIIFTSERTILGAGHEFKPALISEKSADNWEFKDFIDKKKEEDTSKAAGGVAAARALFVNKTSRGQETKTEGDVLWTQHESAITDLKAKGKNVSSSSLDGRVVLWDASLLA